MLKTRLKEESEMPSDEGTKVAEEEFKGEKVEEQLDELFGTGTPEPEPNYEDVEAEAEEGKEVEKEKIEGKEDGDAGEPEKVEEGEEEKEGTEPESDGEPEGEGEPAEGEPEGKEGEEEKPEEGEEELDEAGQLRVENEALKKSMAELLIDEKEDLLADKRKEVKRETVQEPAPLQATKLTSDELLELTSDPDKFHQYMTNQMQLVRQQTMNEQTASVVNILNTRDTITDWFAKEENKDVAVVMKKVREVAAEMQEIEGADSTKSIPEFLKEAADLIRSRYGNVLDKLSALDEQVDKKIVKRPKKSASRGRFAPATPTRGKDVKTTEGKGGSATDDVGDQIEDLATLEFDGMLGG
jgi:hypothetical protein